MVKHACSIYELRVRQHAYIYLSYRKTSLHSPSKPHSFLSTKNSIKSFSRLITTQRVHAIQVLCIQTSLGYVKHLDRQEGMLGASLGTQGNSITAQPATPSRKTHSSWSLQVLLRLTNMFSNDVKTRQTHLISDDLVLISNPAATVHTPSNARARVRSAAPARSCRKAGRREYFTSVPFLHWCEDDLLDLDLLSRVLYFDSDLLQTSFHHTRVSL